MLGAGWYPTCILGSVLGSPRVDEGRGFLSPTLGLGQPAASCDRMSVTASVLQITERFKLITPYGVLVGLPDVLGAGVPDGSGSGPIFPSLTNEMTRNTIMASTMAHSA